MDADEIAVTVVTDPAEAPGWVEMSRDYLRHAVARHREATGEVVDPEAELRRTVEHVDDFLRPGRPFVAATHPERGLLGMVLLRRMASGKGEVKRLYVSPAERRRGLARRLMALLEAEARAMGCRALYLDTSVGLREAIAFYRTLGFADAAFDAASVQDPEVARHLVFMEKPL